MQEPIAQIWNTVGAEQILFSLPFSLFLTQPGQWRQAQDSSAPSANGALCSHEISISNRIRNSANSLIVNPKGANNLLGFVQNQATASLGCVFIYYCFVVTQWEGPVLSHQKLGSSLVGQ